MCASDEGRPVQMSATTKVLVIVHQENLHPPVFTEDGPFPIPVSQFTVANDVVNN